MRPSLALPNPALRKKIQVSPGKVGEHHSAAKDSWPGFLIHCERAVLGSWEPGTAGRTTARPATGLAEVPTS